MTWKRTLSFLSVLALLAGIYFFKVYERPSGAGIFSFSPEAARTSILQLGKGETVTRLSLRNFDEETDFLFEKLPERQWRVKQPVDYPAEPLVVEGLVSALKLSPRIRQLSFEGLEAVEFGFDKPRFSICVGIEEKARMRCLTIGRDPAIGRGAYAKWEDESNYFLVDQNFMAAFDKTLYSVRKKQIFTLLDQEVRTIKYRSENSELEMTRVGKTWMVRKPVEAMLGPDAVHRLLTELNSLYVKEFLDGIQWEDSSLGLKSSKRAIRVEFQDGSVQTLIQGAQAAGRDAYYALGEEQTIFLVSLGKMKQVEDAFRKL